MQVFNVDKEKTLNAALLILNKLGKADFHKVFKILYFAEQQHLKKYGQPLTGDVYQAMPYGPVPSFLYDIFKASENQSSPFSEALELSKAFLVTREDKIPYVTPTREPDTDELSETNIEAILNSISEVPFTLFGYGVDLLFQLALFSIIIGSRQKSTKNSQ